MHDTQYVSSRGQSEVVGNRKLLSRTASGWPFRLSLPPTLPRPVARTTIRYIPPGREDGREKRPNQSGPGHGMYSKNDVRVKEQEVGGPMRFSGRNLFC